MSISRLRIITYLFNQNCSNRRYCSNQRFICSNNQYSATWVVSYLASRTQPHSRKMAQIKWRAEVGLGTRSNITWVASYSIAQCLMIAAPTYSCAMSICLIYLILKLLADKRGPEQQYKKIYSPADHGPGRGTWLYTMYRSSLLCPCT